MAVMYKRFLMDFIDLCKALSILSFLLVVFEGRGNLDICSHCLLSSLSFRVRAIFSQESSATPLSQMHVQLPRTVHCVLVIIDYLLVIIDH